MPETSFGTGRNNRAQTALHLVDFLNPIVPALGSGLIVSPLGSFKAVSLQEMPAFHEPDDGLHRGSAVDGFLRDFGGRHPSFMLHINGLLPVFF